MLGTSALEAGFQVSQGAQLGDSEGVMHSANIHTDTARKRRDAVQVLTSTRQSELETLCGALDAGEGTVR